MKKAFMTGFLGIAFAFAMVACNGNATTEDTTANAMWFKNWFDKEKVSRSKDAGPWTRLGYTYDWGNPNSKYGLSEFIVKDGAEIEVKFTRKNRAFLTWLKDRL